MSMPVNQLFIAKLILGKTGKVISIDKQFFYATPNDTLYSRAHKDEEWEVERNGDHPNANCPVEHPEKFHFTALGSPNGTELPLRARTLIRNHSDGLISADMKKKRRTDGRD